MSPEFHLFLPQMRMDLDVIVERARAAERAGFAGIALMDHLAPPMAENHAMHDAIVTAAWIAAHTRTLTIGHLVLCDAFRHPSVLAKQVVALDHASAGRFELGIGWGSVPAEFDTFGIGTTSARARVERLGETLEVLQRLWTGQVVSYEGEYHQLRDAQQLPTPTREIPIVIGGSGPRTIELVARHASWWNLPIHQLDRFDELHAQVGTARTSLQYRVGFVPHESERAGIMEQINRRFAGNGLVVGTAPELVDRFRADHVKGIERIYCWFTDFAKPETLEAFGADVIAELS
jgi:alkanesulfonate monooxygenase SsuD/methylene tetrahydromethanopterin reductase-like flavin-dependent oxidoreductase (luciferase family)